MLVLCDGAADTWFIDLPLHLPCSDSVQTLALMEPHGLGQVTSLGLSFPICKKRRWDQAHDFINKL